MELGWYELSLDVKDVERSSDFYAKLGFQLVGGAPEDGAATVQRGNCRIGLYQGLSPETTLLFRQGDVEAIAADLTAKGLIFERGPASDAKGVGALLRDPDGMAIYFVKLKGKMRDGPASKGDRRLGWFTTSLAVADLERSLDFYHKLGFQMAARAPGGAARRFGRTTVASASIKAISNRTRCRSPSGRGMSRRSAAISPNRGCASSAARTRMPRARAPS